MHKLVCSVGPCASTSLGKRAPTKKAPNRALQGRRHHYPVAEGAQEAPVDTRNRTQRLCMQMPNRLPRTLRQASCPYNIIRAPNNEQQIHSGFIFGPSNRHGDVRACVFPRTFTIDLSGGSSICVYVRKGMRPHDVASYHVSDGRHCFSRPEAHGVIWSYVSQLAPHTTYMVAPCARRPVPLPPVERTEPMQLIELGEGPR